MAISIEQVGVSAGALARGVDFAAIDDGVFDALHKAFLDHHVLCIRGSSISPEQQLAFARRWGTVLVHPYVPSIEGHPGLMQVYQRHVITETWHADVTFAPRPPKITMLVAEELPALGGDTTFANQHIAFESLSAGMRSTLEGMRAVHYGTELAKDAGLEQEQVMHSHPVVISHPHTGRRALYVNGNYTRHFDGWTIDESRPLLEYLWAHCSTIDFTYRHRWEQGDLLMWDNRSVQHRVIADHGTARRILRRVTIEGDPLG
ncbi:MAG TPA: TauD/TfdA family dioxygenase [Acidimicrobiales bacterium]|jgi:taurine dioxygenase|nr:TauD/TfdA family dioxygenase [Acidimicrobiales bacterium]